MKKILFVLFASLLVLGACGNQDEKESKEKSNNSTVEKKKERKEDKSTEEKESKNTNEASTEETQTSNTNERQGSVYQNQQASDVNTQQQGQQVAKQQTPSNNVTQPSQQEDPNTPSYEQYQRQKAFSQDFLNNPQKYENAHMGGGPGMFVEPGESYNEYKNRVVEQMRPPQ